MTTARTRIAVGVAAWMLLPVCLVAQQPEVDAAFGRFWAATSTADAAATAADIVRSGVTFDEAYRRLCEGRPYLQQKTGLLELTHEMPGQGPYGYAVNIPRSYDPSRKSPVAIHLHGGVGRESPNGPAAVNQAAGFAEGQAHS